ncbi:MAG: ABC transporter permease [Clostridia bacterium]|nr:ABC transporter permease [Clostridia bacterium]
MDTLNQISLFLQLTVQMGTPILLGTLGGILNEKVGHTNLGVEGMMLMGAVMGFMVGVNTSNPWLAMLAACLAGAIMSLVYAVVTVTFMGNHTVTGLVLTIFGTGLSGFLGQDLTQLNLPDPVKEVLGAKRVPGLADIPILGNMLFDQSIYIAISIVLSVILFVYMRYTKPGLCMRMIGENPGAADASGINITAYKYVHICLGGALCGLGGSYLSLAYAFRWQEQMTAGIGWIAVALVIFATWDPLKAIFGAYLFGAMRALALKIQNFSFPLFGHEVTIASQFLEMIPYIMTIVVLIFITLRKKKEYQAPASLGLSYFREDR